MSYENAAATSLLATNCMACRRPLLDAASVTAGMGPICRKKYGYDQIPEGVRVAANALIHEAAHAQTSNTRRQEIADELDTLGAGVVASKIRERFLRPAVIVENVEHTFGKGLWATTVAAHAIRVSFNAEYNAAFKDLVDWRDRSPVLRHGKFWGWAVKPQSKADAWRVVVAHFSGQTAQLPDGRYVTIAGPAARVNEGHHHRRVRRLRGLGRHPVVPGLRERPILQGRRRGTPGMVHRGLMKHDWKTTGPSWARIRRETRTRLVCQGCGITAVLVETVDHLRRTSSVVVHDRPFRIVRYDTCKPPRRRRR